MCAHNGKWHHFASGAARLKQLTCCHIMTGQENGLDVLIVVERLFQEDGMEKLR
jgi:hypothetical protein